MKKLFDAKAEIPVIKKDANNPFFKSGYATLSRIIEVTEPVLAKQGLFITHSLKEGRLITALWDSATAGNHQPLLISDFTLPVNTDIQKIGSAITYAKRYNITALLNLNIEDDDDGNGAKPETKNTPKETPAYKSALKAVNEATDFKLMAERINESTKLTTIEKDTLLKILNERNKK